MGERLIEFSIASIRFAEYVRQNSLLRSCADQYIRSATSVGANFTEAQAAGSRKDYTRYFRIALKSANESMYWLTIIGRVDSHLSSDAKHLSDELRSIAAIIAKSITSLKDSQ